MISDVACEPELPPELMISGMNRVSTIAFSSSLSKYCMALAVSISRGTGRASQPARFLIMAEKADLHIGRVEGLHAAELLGVLGVVVDDGVDDVVDRDDAEDHAGLSSTTGTASRSYLEISRATFSRRCVGGSPKTACGRRADGQDRRLRVGGHQSRSEIAWIRTPWASRT